MKLSVLGFDPSMTHWGVAGGIYNTKSGTLKIKTIDCIIPVKITTKSAFTNTVDIDVGKQLFKQVLSVAEQHDIIFAEVPVGTRSSRGMCAYGMCCQLIGALEILNNPCIQVTASQVKKALHGNPKASKHEMIAAAFKQYPNLNWPTHQANGRPVMTGGKAEHMADAIGAILAGLQTNQFQSLLSIHKRK